MNYMELGQRVRARRAELNWTQERLAQEIGVSTSFIGHIERGSRRASLDTLVLIANAMEISTDELLQDSLAPATVEKTPVRHLTKRQMQAMHQMLSTLQEQITAWEDKE